jgi:hypothetical protein
MSNAYSDDEMEDLEANAAVMLMVNMQELHMSDTCLVYDTDGLSQVPDPNICLIHEFASPSASDKEQFIQDNSLSSLYDDDQINPVVTFDDPIDDQVNPVVTFDDQIDDYNNDQLEQVETSFDPDPDLMTLLLNR